MKVLISGVFASFVFLAGCNSESDPLREIVKLQKNDKSDGQYHQVKPDHNVLIVSPSQSGQVIELKVGQVVSIPKFSNEMKWQVDYEHAIIRNITPASKGSSPDSEGWLFQAIMEGETQLMMTGYAGGNSMPSPATMRLTFIFKVIK